MLFVYHAVIATLTSHKLFIVKPSTEFLFSRKLVESLIRFDIVLQDDLDLYDGTGSRVLLPSKRSSDEPDGVGTVHTQEALRELFQQVSNMPESAKKKKFIRQVIHNFYFFEV